MNKDDDAASPPRMRPSGRDQLVVLLQSLGFFLLVMVIGFRGEPMTKLVLLIIAAFATLTINILFAFSQWDAPHNQDNQQRDE